MLSWVAASVRRAYGLTATVRGVSGTASRIDKPPRVYMRLPSRTHGEEELRSTHRKSWPRSPRLTGCDRRASVATNSSRPQACNRWRREPLGMWVYVPTAEQGPPRAIASRSLIRYWGWSIDGDGITGVQLERPATSTTDVATTLGPSGSTPAKSLRLVRARVCRRSPTCGMNPRRR